MKNNHLLAIMLLGSIIALTSCKDDDDDYTMENQTFVTQASSSNSLEIQAGNLAIEKASNMAVHHYGEHMVNDHSAAGTELELLAARKGWQLAGSLLIPHQNMLNQLTPLSGPAFDQAFANVMVQSHREAVSLFEQASRANGVRDNELRKWASDKLPTLKEHLEEAEDLQEDVNP